MTLNAPQTEFGLLDLPHPYQLFLGDITEPGYAKTVYNLGVRPLGGGRTLIWALMRTAATDEHARRWFLRYWTLGVGSGAHVLAYALLDSVREEAERRAQAAP